jgi:hypothetical protein
MVQAGEYHHVEGIPGPASADVAAYGALRHFELEHVSNILQTWNPSNLHFHRMLTLPALTASDEVALQQLVAHCKPATFGRGGEDVYDESYCKATALDTTEYVDPSLALTVS